MKKIVWDICYSCNFLCEYCFFVLSGQKNKMVSPIEVRSPDVIEEAWSDIGLNYGRSHIHITGGEPFLYPDFVEIVFRLSKFHKIHITSNLSQEIDTFIRRINPINVEFNFSFHPLYMDYVDFINKVIMARKAGFVCGVTYLAHPFQLHEMMKYKEYFKTFNIDMTIIEFYGTYKCKEYPLSYSYEERQNISCNADRKNKYKSGWYDTNESKITDGGYAVRQTPDIPKICGAEFDELLISVEGDVRPCLKQKRMSLGNLYLKNIRF